MRVIAGTAGRLRIEAPKSLARPSTDRLREALFSILGTRVTDARVLDLFAGSGALGIEALSRGAQSALFVDSDRLASKAIDRNLQHTRLDDRGRILQRDAMQALKGLRGPFDLVFADPPYFTGGEREVDHGRTLLACESLVALMAEDGVLVLETGNREPPTSPLWVCDDSRHYGKSHLHFFTRE